jgi:hypothetical protein
VPAAQVDHAVQLDAPAALHVLAPHAVQLAAFVVELYVPAAHETHVPPLEYEPGWHVKDTVMRIESTDGVRETIRMLLFWACTTAPKLDALMSAAVHVVPHRSVADP